jgi:hypothetical protein
VLPQITSSLATTALDDAGKKLASQFFFPGIFLKNQALLPCGPTFERSNFALPAVAALQRF